MTASGPYRWLAHPLYVGSSVMGVGLAVAAASRRLALLIAVYLAVTLTAAVRSEEAFLPQRFGERYDRVPTRRRRVDVERADSAWHRPIANGEHRTVAGLAARPVAAHR